jgi:hypothetical protein
MGVTKFVIIHLDNLFELTSFLIAAWAYPYLKYSYMKWFLPFLGFIFVSETAPNIVPIGFHTTYLSLVIQAAFYGYIFCQLTSKTHARLIILILMRACMVAYVFSYLFLDTSRLVMFNFVKVTLAFDLVLTAIGLNYLYQAFLADKNEVSLREPGIWIAVGVIIFYSGFSFVIALYPYIIERNLRVFGIRLYHLIPRFLSVALYSCLSIAVILFRHRKYRDRNLSGSSASDMANISHFQMLI